MSVIAIGIACVVVIVFLFVFGVLNDDSRAVRWGKDDEE